LIFSDSPLDEQGRLFLLIEQPGDLICGSGRRKTMPPKKRTSVTRAASRAKRRRTSTSDQKLDQAIIKIKKESKSKPEAVKRIKELTAEHRVLYGNRPQARLVSLSEGRIRVHRIEVSLPSGINPDDLPPQGGDPADGDIGDYDPPWDTDRCDREDLDGL
jgi:hypothetical protein